MGLNERKNNIRTNVFRGKFGQDLREGNFICNQKLLSVASIQCELESYLSNLVHKKFSTDD